MAFNASPQQALAMFSIVFASRESERRPQMGDWLKPRERAPLEQARLIELEKDGRAHRVTLTDAGWAWAAANLNAGLPGRNRAARVLQDVLTRLGPLLDSSNAALAQFAAMPPYNNQIGARPIAANKPPAKNTLKPAAKGSAVSKAPAKTAGAKRLVTLKSVPTKADAKQQVTKRPGPKRVVAKKPSNSHRPASERIRLAALSIAGGKPRTRVRLRDLRARLKDVPRAQLDRELMELQRTGSLVLYQIDDPTDITEDDKLAALQVAGYPRHILYLES